MNSHPNTQTGRHARHYSRTRELLRAWQAGSAAGRRRAAAEPVRELSQLDQARADRFHSWGVTR